MKINVRSHIISMILYHIINMSYYMTATMFFEYSLALVDFFVRTLNMTATMFLILVEQTYHYIILQLQRFARDDLSEALI